MRKYLKAELIALFITAFFLIFSCNSQADSIPPTSTTPQLYYPAINTVSGNPNGKVTVVEFFDYRCRYCRQSFPYVQQLIRTNPQVRVIYREYPILGDTSVYAARAALAAYRQGKYTALHAALMRTTRPLDPSSILRAAQAVGINTQQLTSDMTNNLVDQQLQATSALAQDLGVNAVPTFVVAKTPDASYNGTIPGYVMLSPSLMELRTVISQLSK